ncbi:unnamed protein product [Blepharisma stoltei]|uniref:Uncharacterized protein n=1 Tax=Blepharisma stoltei TaxID=1481888 RepID=A0AAU9JQA3_9CILI|nr:unnamed protein product [Blepharisma stoltei]
MALLLLLIIQIQYLLHTSLAYNIDILISKSTNPDLATYLWSSINKKFQNNFTVSLSSVESCNFQSDCIHLPSIAIDATFNTFYSFQLKQSSETQHFLYISLREPTGSYGKYEFSVIFLLIFVIKL